MSKILDVLETLVACVRDHALCLPVSSEDLVPLNLNGWHLESEKVKVEWSSCLSHLAGLGVVNAGISTVLSIESSKNNDLILVNLTDSGSLSLWEEMGSNLSYLPGW